MPPPIAGWRRVTLDTAPFADRIQTARGPCCEKAITFDDMSCVQGNRFAIIKKTQPKIHKAGTSTKAKLKQEV